MEKSLHPVATLVVVVVVIGSENLLTEGSGFYFRGTH